jgi:hypothetical protein
VDGTQRVHEQRGRRPTYIVANAIGVEGYTTNFTALQREESRSKAADALLNIGVRAS